MTTPQGPEAPNDGNPLAASASYANAYAIAYRLVGDRDAARSIAGAVADSYAPDEGTDPTRWLPDLAADAVTASLMADPAPADPGTADPGTADAGTDPDRPTDSQLAGVRLALRRRLSSADARTRAAVGLHLLAGYPAERVAELMSSPPATVQELCAPLAPPPGVTYAELGDPLVRGVVEPVVRSRRRRPRVPVLPVLAVVVVVALAWWATSVSGPRPSLGPAAAGAPARFGADPDPLPSAGCTAPGSSTTPGSSTAPGVSTETATVFDQPVAYRLSTPAAAPDAPAPLVLALPDYHQSAEQFQASTQLEAALPGSFVATLEPEAPLLEVNSAASPERRDDRAAAGAVVDAVVVQRCVDLRRVHVVGAGPGGQLAGMLACAAPDTYATASMVGGWAMPADCLLDPAVAALLTSNADDPVLPPGGGYGPGAVEVNPAGTPTRPEAAPFETVATRWATAVGADAVTVDAEADDTMVTDRRGPDGVQVLSVLHPTGGHAWGPGDTIAVVDFQQRHARTI